MRIMFDCIFNAKSIIWDSFSDSSRVHIFSCNTHTWFELEQENAEKKEEEKHAEKKGKKNGGGGGGGGGGGKHANVKLNIRLFCQV